MNKKKNLLTALILQIVTMVSGLVLPRLIISTFGSEVNGLVSSITQFLSFISLLEGGLGAVVLAELYKPIEDKDDRKINSILTSCQNFFKHLTVIFIVYTVLLGVIYGFFLRDKFTFGFVCSLTFILSFTTLVQYLFSITYKLLLQAQQKMYIVNSVSTGTVMLNFIIAIVLVKVFPDIHAIKLGSAIAFLIQPLVFSHYCNKKYKEKLRKENHDKYEIRNRWDGFAQNLAHFVNLNTDIVIITIFLTLSDVSVYSVYMLPITALRSIIASLTNSYQSALGKYYAQGDYGELRMHFNRFDNANIMITTAMFSACLVLINPFVSLYTAGISDADYYKPLFAIIIVLANMIYCIREPYRFLILAAGKFKETNKGAVLEAVINLVVSVALIWKMGLVGVAIGTLVAITYRFIYFMTYLKSNILMKQYQEYVFGTLKVLVFIAINITASFLCKIKINNYMEFAIFGVIIFAVEAAVSYLLFMKKYKIIKGKRRTGVRK